MQTKKIDTILLFVMFCVSIIATYYFLRPISFDHSNQRSILATIESGSNIVKIRSSLSPFWQEALPHDLLSHRDMIYTHDDSSAAIVLTNGASIMLGEKTLFRLDKDQLGKTALELERGTLKASIPEGGLEVSSTRVTGKGSEVLVSKQDGVQLLTPLSDNIKVDFGADGGQVSLKTDEQLVINPKAKKAHIVRSLSLEHAFPSINQKFFSLSPFSLTFDYKLKHVHALTAPSVIQLSRHSQFKSLIELSGNTISLKDEGQYYWRVGQEHEGKLQWSNPRPFFINLLRPAELLSPFHQSILGPVESSGSLEVWLKWRVAHAQKYIITLIHPDQSEHTYPSDRPQFKLVLNQSGNYLWKVTSLYEDINIQKLDSSWQSFTIKNTPVTAPASSLMPLDGASLSLFSAKGIGVNLSWKAATNSEESWVDLFDAKGQHISTHVVYDTKLFLPLKYFGKYYWQVRSRSSQQVEVLSDRYAFNIRYIALKSNFPDRGVELQLERPNQNVKFEWQADAPGARYLYELSTEQDFSTIVLSREVAGNRLELSFPQLGVYYWRTKIILPNGDFSFSEPVRVQVSPSPPPEAPELDPESVFKIELRSVFMPRSLIWRTASFIRFLITSLHAQDGIIAGNYQTQATLEWKKYSNAAFYQVEIYRDADAKELLLSKKVRSAELVFDNPGAGDYYWRVAIIDHWGRQGPFSKLVQLKLVLSAKLDPLKGAELVLPRVKEEIYPGSLFRWRGDSRTLEYRFQLANDILFNTIIFQRITTKQKIQLPSTVSFDGAKNFYWRVISTDELNRHATSEIREVRKIEEVAKIIEKKQAPLLLSQNNTPFSPDYAFTFCFGAESLTYQEQQAANSISFDGRSPLSASIGLYSLRPTLLPGFEFSALFGTVFDQNYSLYQAQLSWRLQQSRFYSVELWSEFALHWIGLTDFSPPVSVDDHPQINKMNHIYLPRLNLGLSLPFASSWRLLGDFALSYDLSTSYYRLSSSIYREISPRLDFGISFQYAAIKYEDLTLNSSRLLASTRWRF